MLRVECKEKIVSVLTSHRPCESHPSIYRKRVIFRSTNQSAAGGAEQAVLLQEAVTGPGLSCVHTDCLAQAECFWTLVVMKCCWDSECWGVYLVGGRVEAPHPLLPKGWDLPLCGHQEPLELAHPCAVGQIRTNSPRGAISFLNNLQATETLSCQHCCHKKISIPAS